MGTERVRWEEVLDGRSPGSEAWGIEVRLARFWGSVQEGRVILWPENPGSDAPTKER